MQTEDGAAVLRDVSAILREYLVMTVEQADIVGLWCMHAHAIDAFDVTPYLAIQSPTRECGKSMLLDAIEQLVPNPFCTAGSSVPVVFRTIDSMRPTALMDEMDAAAAGNKERFSEMLGLLNQGHRRGRPVGRCEGRDFKLRLFQVFCAKVLVGIKKLPDTLQSRCIVVNMRRKRRDERIRRFRMDEISLRCAPLRGHMAAWVANHLKTLCAAKPDIPETIDGRLADCWAPLIAIADLVGGDWPARARSLALVAPLSVDDQDLGVRVLEDLNELLAEQSADSFTAAELIEKLCALPEAPWATLANGKPINAHRLAKLLKPFAIRSRQAKINEVNERRYHQADFEDAFSRYLRQSDLQSATSATSLTQQGFAPFLEVLPKPQGNTSKNRADPHEIKEVAEVALPGGDRGLTDPDHRLDEPDPTLDGHCEELAVSAAGQAASNRQPAKPCTFFVGQPNETPTCRRCGSTWERHCAALTGEVPYPRFRPPWPGYPGDYSSRPC